VKRIDTRWIAAIVVTLLAVPELARAQTDEIQVYDGGLALPGTFNLTLHNNFTPKGERIPSFAGAVVADKSLNGASEFALGVTSWFEAGLYLPVYSRDKNTGWGLDAVKLRLLFAVPNAGSRTFVYGANFEFSYNAKRWDPTRFTSEIRPIVGWHLKPVDIIFNPILDTSYDGIRNFVFAPATRVVYGLSPEWTTGVEEYADFGPLHAFRSPSEQAHQVYWVIDHAGKTWGVEAGAGVGLTNGSDRLTFKLILSRDFNK
jgi:hypothetical protein